jgi:hypothetical protein
MTDGICGSTDTASGEPCETPEHLCQWHNSDADSPDNGRPSKFGDARDDLLEAADSFKNIKQVANSGGIDESTLYRYLDEYPDFCKSFKRARADAAERLIQRGLDQDDDIDMSFVRFLLERSFHFVKTERKEISGPDGDPIPTARVPTDDQLDEMLADAEAAL